MTVEPLSVELRGLEPLTPCMPCRCATSCATAPHRFPSCGSPLCDATLQPRIPRDPQWSGHRLRRRRSRPRSAQPFLSSRSSAQWQLCQAGDGRPRLVLAEPDQRGDDGAPGDAVGGHHRVLARSPARAAGRRTAARTRTPSCDTSRRARRGAGPSPAASAACSSGNLLGDRRRRSSPATHRRGSRAGARPCATSRPPTSEASSRAPCLARERSLLIHDRRLVRRERPAAARAGLGPPEVGPARCRADPPRSRSALWSVGPCRSSTSSRRGGPGRRRGGRGTPVASAQRAHRPHPSRRRQGRRRRSPPGLVGSRQRGQLDRLEVDRRGSPSTAARARRSCAPRRAARARRCRRSR